jgi:Outer membrane protein (porin)
MSSRLKRARGGRSSHPLFWWAFSLLAVFAAFASSAAHAQSSVVLYGIIDTGIEYVTNVGPQKSSSVHAPSLTASLPSLWGLRGKEDLGGGLSAVFLLESGFAPSQGTLNQGGRLFGRQAYVGLSGPWGTFTLGRQYSQIFWAVLTGDTLAPNIYAAADLDPYLTQPRVDNAITYTFTTSGLTVAAMYSFGRDAVDSAPAGGCAGQSPTDWRACKAMSAMLKYDAGKWGVAVAVDRNYGGGGTGSPCHVVRKRIRAPLSMATRSLAARLSARDSSIESITACRPRPFSTRSATTGGSVAPIFRFRTFLLTHSSAISP